MSPRSITLVGVPDSGKTNYIGRLWAALQSRKGRLVAPSLPTEIEFVEDTLAHLLQGEFAPRSDKSLGDNRRDFVVPVEHVSNGKAERVELLVPDVSGEVWKSAVETFEISSEWMAQLQRSMGALLFVRILSKHNIVPNDWVTTEKYLRSLEPDQKDSSKIPTQVVLCELLRFLELSLQRGQQGQLPRVAVVVSAWDLLDEERRAAGPLEFLKREYPLFAGKMLYGENLEVRAFGVSVVGGDFAEPHFREEFLESGELETSGYCAVITNDACDEVPDLTYPVAWLVEPRNGDE